MLFFYKLPLLVSINEREYPLWVKQSKHNYSLFAEFKKGEVKFTTDCIKIMLAIGTMPVDEEFNLTSEKNPFMIFLTINKKDVILYG